MVVVLRNAIDIPYALMLLLAVAEACDSSDVAATPSPEATVWAE